MPIHHHLDGTMTVEDTMHQQEDGRPSVHPVTAETEAAWLKHDPLVLGFAGVFFLCAVVLAIAFDPRLWWRP
jgi:hypothetical protein